MNNQPLTGLTPDLTNAFNQITGGKVSATPNAGPSRADEIRALGKQTPVSDHVNFLPTQEQDAKIATGAKAVDSYGKNILSQSAQPLEKATSQVVADTKKGAASGTLKGELGAGVDVAGDIAGGVVKEGGNLVQSAVVKPLAKLIGNIPGLDKVATSKPITTWLDNNAGGVQYLADKWNQFSSDHPEASKKITDAGNIAQFMALFIGDTPEVKNAVKTGADNLSQGIGQGVDTTKSAVADTLKTAKEAIIGTPEEQAARNQPKPLDEKKVLDLYNRSIKPSVAGKTNAGQIAKGNTQVVSGLKAIEENKSALSFTDADGETVQGEAPRSVDQLTQAIAQTKASIYKQYDTLAAQAGEKGVTVKAPQIATELQPVIDSKSLAIANPKAVQYAEDLQKRLNSAGEIDAQTAQDIIQHYNESLKAFYRNPSYETASQASIDALIANKFREQLDEGITGSTGKQYQDLKDKYGSLAAMEKDVAKRNVVWGRQNNVGLASNLGNIASGAELVRGLLTMNPADIGVSLGIKGIQAYMKYLNNPDVGVAKIFSEIEKSGPSATGSTPGSAAKDTVIDSSGDSTIDVPGKSRVTIKAGNSLESNIGNIDIIKGVSSAKGKSGYGLAKIEGDHPEVLPYLENAIKTADVVESLPQRTILETKGAKPIRIIIDHQLGTKPQTFLNNAYFKNQ